MRIGLLINQIWIAIYKILLIRLKKQPWFIAVAG